MPFEPDKPKSGFVPDTAKEPTLKDRLAQGLGYLGTGLDYVGGIARTGLSLPIGDLTGLNDQPGKELYQEGDLMRALKGNAPTGSEYLERAGVGEHGKLSDLIPKLYSETGEGIALQKGGPLDPTGRGTIGAVIDTAADPLTYLSFGTSAGAKALRPVATAEKTVGKKVYRSGFKKVDEHLAKYGKEPLSDIMFQEGKSAWTSKGLAHEADDLAEKLKAQRDKLELRADELGADPQMVRAMEPTLEKIKKIRESKDPALQKIADAYEEKVAEYVGLKPSVQQTSGYKTSLYEGIGDPNFEIARNTPLGKELDKTMARGLKEEIERSADAVAPILGQDIKNVNSKLGSVLSSRKPLQKEISKESSKTFLTSVDPFAAYAGPGVLAAKKTADALKLPGVRTKLGMGIHGLQYLPTDELLREQLRLNKSPWSLMGEEEKK